MSVIAFVVTLAFQFQVPDDINRMEAARGAPASGAQRDFSDASEQYTDSGPQVFQQVRHQATSVRT